MYQIEDLININLKNYNSVCYKYGYKNDKIINEDDKKYYVTILNVKCPWFIFIGFEFWLPEDLEVSKGNVKSDETLNLISFNRVKKNLLTIKGIIKEEIEVFNTKFLLRGLICYPFSGNYTGLIINLFEDFKYKNYFNDDRLNNNEIIEIKDNWRDTINSNLPNILINAKQWLYIYISIIKKLIPQKLI